MKIRQIDIKEALELAKSNTSINVITNPHKPVIKSFNNMSVGDVLAEANDYIFFVLEEG